MTITGWVFFTPMPLHCCLKEAKEKKGKIRIKIRELKRKGKNQTLNLRRRKKKKQMFILNFFENSWKSQGIEEVINYTQEKCLIVNKILPQQVETCRSNYVEQCGKGYQVAPELSL